MNCNVSNFMEYISYLRMLNMYSEDKSIKIISNRVYRLLSKNHSKIVKLLVKCKRKFKMEYTSDIYLIINSIISMLGECDDDTEYVDYMIEEMQEYLTSY